MLFLVASALCAAVAQVKASIPDQPVEIVLELSGFEAKSEMQTERTLLAGEFGGGINLSVLFEENMPYMASDECGGRQKNEKKFLVGDVTCTEATETVARGAAEITTFHAYPVNSDYLFDIHVSITRADKKSKTEFTRAQFTSVVKSFAVTGGSVEAALSARVLRVPRRGREAREGSDGVGRCAVQGARGRHERSLLPRPAREQSR
jgi:hypothetical protein